jgi:DNA-binding NarL/FixJ family response regulator
VVRVVVAAMPRMIRDVIIGILGEAPDITVSPEDPDTEALLDVARRTQAHVIIVGDSEVSDAERNRLLADGKRLKVLSLASRGARASLFELQPAQIPLGELTPESLVEVVRSCGDSG